MRNVLVYCTSGMWFLFHLLRGYWQGTKWVRSRLLQSSLQTRRLEEEGEEQEVPCHWKHSSAREEEERSKEDQSPKGNNQCGCPSSG